ncbi:MAG: prolipoprotein diacylglyceryl transferase [Bacteroidota bacterium]
MDWLIYIPWNPDPEAFNILGRGIRWYGILFSLGFLAGVYICQAMFRRENIPEEWLEIGFISVLIGAIFGARLGHVFFYDWPYYSKNLIEIPMVWKGGLASHGAILGLGVTLWIYSRYVTKRSMVWIFDRMVVPTALAACFIRLGNLMNSEIVGLPAKDVPWAFVFKRLQDRPDIVDPLVPRHPVQIYEALAYLAIFVFLMYLYWRTDAKDRRGLIFGWFMTLIFTARFFLEYFKNSQGGFESSLGNILTTGQWLSIPCVVAGLYFIWRGYTREPNPWPPVKITPKPAKKKK